MPQKTEAQSNIRVEIEALWRTFAQDFTVSWAKVLPDIVTGVTRWWPRSARCCFSNLSLLDVRAGGPTVPFQKTKIVEFDSTKHQLGLEVLEGAGSLK